MRIIPRSARASCLRVFNRACPFSSPLRPSFSLAQTQLNSTLSLSFLLPSPSRLLLVFLASTIAHLVSLSSTCRLAPSPSSSFVGPLPRRRRKRAGAHVRPHYPRAAAPRSLIVHRNRNSVPLLASHDDGDGDGGGLSILSVRHTSSDSLTFVRNVRVSTLPHRFRSDHGR